MLLSEETSRNKPVRTCWLMIPRARCFYMARHRGSVSDSDRDSDMPRKGGRTHRARSEIGGTDVDRVPAKLLRDVEHALMILIHLPRILRMARDLADGALLDGVTQVARHGRLAGHGGVGESARESAPEQDTRLDLVEDVVAVGVDAELELAVDVVDEAYVHNANLSILLPPCTHRHPRTAAPAHSTIPPPASTCMPSHALHTMTP